MWARARACEQPYVHVCGHLDHQYIDTCTHTHTEREVLETCRAAAVLDCILALAVTAVERDWVEPELVHEPVLYVEAGRHPLAELCVETFVPNDSLMDFDNNQSTIQVLTGPNYSGKSVYLKQVALIVYLAHLGSWVPAKSCQVPLTFWHRQDLSACWPCVKGQSVPEM